MKALIKLAAHPERLRIVILNQYNFDYYWDIVLVQEVKEYIAEVES